MMINVLEYLERTLERMADPDKVAFTGAGQGDGSSVLSFRELSDQSRSIGSYLASQNIRKQPVAVFMRKSPAMIAAFLGVVYGGNYYIPLDSEMPAFRIKLILEAVDPPLIICDDVTAALLEDMTEGRFLCHTKGQPPALRSHPLRERMGHGAGKTDEPSPCHAVPLSRDPY